MPRYVAFLRAVNVGGRRIKMDALKALFEAQGFSRVETFIASGNVIFNSAFNEIKTLERRVEISLREALGYEVATFIRPLASLQRIAEHQSFKNLAPEVDTLYIAFLERAPNDESRTRLNALASPVDEFEIEGQEVYWLCHRRMSESLFTGALLERALLMKATIRNSTTVRKLVSKYRLDKGGNLDGK